MPIDTLLPVESGTLYFLECVDYLSPTCDEIDTSIHVIKDCLRAVITLLVLPIFSCIGIFYNLASASIKIPSYFCFLKNRTLYFQIQIRTHFIYILFDLFNYFIVPSRYIWSAINFIDPVITTQIANSIKKELFPKVPKYYVDPRLHWEGCKRTLLKKHL